MTYHNQYHRYNSNGENPAAGIDILDWMESENIFQVIHDDIDVFGSESILVLSVAWCMEKYMETGIINYDPELAIPSFEECIER